MEEAKKGRGRPRKDFEGEASQEMREQLKSTRADIAKSGVDDTREFLRYVIRHTIIDNIEVVKVLRLEKAKWSVLSTLAYVLKNKDGRWVTSNDARLPKEVREKLAENGIKVNG